MASTNDRPPFWFYVFLSLFMLSALALGTAEEWVGADLAAYHAWPWAIGYWILKGYFFFIVGTFVTVLVGFILFFVGCICYALATGIYHSIRYGPPQIDWEQWAQDVGPEP